MDLNFRTVTGKVYALKGISPKLTVEQAKLELSKQNPGLDPKQLQFILPSGALSNNIVLETLIPTEAYIILHQSNSCSLDEIPISQNQFRRPSTLSLYEDSSTPSFQRPHRKSKESQSVSQQSTTADDSLAHLVEMGFDQDVCQRALSMCHGNIENAANMLLSGSAPSHNSPPNDEPVDYNALFDSLSSKEKSTVQRLATTFNYPQDVVLQVYFACEKNEASTTSCLENL